MQFEKKPDDIVVCGYGIVSCLGNTPEEVSQRLYHLESGIVTVPEYAARYFGSKVAGVPHEPDKSWLDRRQLANMGPGALYNIVAARDALKMSGLHPDIIQSPRLGAVMATGCGSPQAIYEMGRKGTEIHLKNQAEGGTKRSSKLGTTSAVAVTMGSTNSANAKVVFGCQGPSYTVSSACASSAIAVELAADSIKLGKADLMLAGGGEEEGWLMTSLFDGMQALAYGEATDEPTTVSRPFDKDRKGFVIAGGGGCILLARRKVAEELKLPIHAVLAGYANTSDEGHKMTDPTVEGPARAMRQALKNADMEPSEIDYINAHGTSTPVGDLNEMTAIQEVFGAARDWDGSISSTKALTGHSLGATGIQEAVYSLLAIEDGFVPGSANLGELDPEIAKRSVSGRIARQSFRSDIQTAMSNSFGFGGTNETLIFRKDAA